MEGSYSPLEFLMSATPTSKGARMQLTPVAKSLKKHNVWPGKNCLDSGDNRMQLTVKTTDALTPAPETKTIPTLRFQLRKRLIANPMNNATTAGIVKPPMIANFTQPGGFLAEGMEPKLTKANKLTMYTKKPETAYNATLTTLRTILDLTSAESAEVLIGVPSKKEKTKTRYLIIPGIISAFIGDVAMPITEPTALQTT